MPQTTALLNPEKGFLLSARLWSLANFSRGPRCRAAIALMIEDGRGHSQPSSLSCAAPNTAID